MPFADELPTWTMAYAETNCFWQTFGDGHNATLILAHGFKGIIAYWILPEGGATKAVFYLFLHVVLLPALRGQRRCIIMDNLKSHKSAEINALLLHEGHVVVYR